MACKITGSDVICFQQWRKSRSLPAACTWRFFNVSSNGIWHDAPTDDCCSAPLCSLSSQALVSSHRRKSFPSWCPVELTAASWAAVPFWRLSEGFQRCPLTLFPFEVAFFVSSLKDEPKRKLSAEMVSAVCLASKLRAGMI